MNGNLFLNFKGIMKKSIQLALYVFGGLISLLLLALVVIALTFNPNDYKQKIIDLVKQKKERTLKIEGDIHLAFWPKIGADLGGVSISEHKNSAEFASVGSVKVSLALLPLLKKELVVDKVYIDAAKANIIKYKDGTTNFDDLMSKDDEPSNEIKFDIDGVSVKNSALNYHDEAAHTQYHIAQFNLQSGHIALAKPFDLTTDFMVTSTQPKVSANAKIKGNFLADPKSKHFVAKGLSAAIKGDLFGGKNVDFLMSGDVDAKLESHEFLLDDLKFVGSGQFNDAKLSVNLNAPQFSAQKDVVFGKKTMLSLVQEKAGDTLKANLDILDIKGSPKTLESSGITGNVSSLQGERTMTLQFSSPFNGSLEHLIFDLPKLVGSLEIKDPNLPNGGMKGSFNVLAHTDIKNELAHSQFSFSLDDTKLNGDVDVASFKKPNIKFNLSADKLNLNKLLAKSAPVKKSSDKPADLSAMKALLLDGKVRVASIEYDKHRVSNLNVAIKADGERLMLNDLNLKVDDSQIKGGFAISNFAKPLYHFDLELDALDVDQYVSAGGAEAKANTADKPFDLMALKALNADGKLRIGNIKYGKTKASNIVIDLKADGQKLNLNPFAAKIDDSQVSAIVGITQFNNPIYHFNVNVDRLDADKYLSKSSSSNKGGADVAIDLSALKKLNASGEAKIGWLKLANVKTENVNLGLKVEGGVATLAPFSASLYQGNMSGLLKVDARATPSIYFKQSMKDILIAPLLLDSINNDMLAGKGSLNVDINTSGNTVSALKKSLAGQASFSLADGALKGVDIAGGIRELKSKVNFLKAKDANADKSKKTDFSELTASFEIKNGVAHNDDLAMKSPILRLAKGDSRGDIDIANETIQYLAKPTIVKSLKGQEGADLDSLSGFSIPLKITGTFASPKYGMDFAAIGAALAKSNLLEKVGGEKAAAVKSLVGGGDKVDAINHLLGKKKAAEPLSAVVPAPSESTPAPAEAPKSVEDQAKEKAAAKLKKILNF